MIAVDTSSMIAFLEGKPGRDTDTVDWALQHAQALLPPVVLCELLSDPRLSADLRILFKSLPALEIFDGYWERAGQLRAAVLERKKRARMANTLIAQTCIDHSIAMVTRDQDFRNFEKESRLQLLHG